MYIYIYIYTYICVYIYIYTYMYTHCFCSLQTALWKFKYPRAWPHLSRLGFWTISVCKSWTSFENASFDNFQMQLLKIFSLDFWTISPPRRRSRLRPSWGGPRGAPVYNMYYMYTYMYSMYSMYDMYSMYYIICILCIICLYEEARSVRLWYSCIICICISLSIYRYIYICIYIHTYIHMYMYVYVYV